MNRAAAVPMRLLAEFDFPLNALPVDDVELRTGCERIFLEKSECALGVWRVLLPSSAVQKIQGGHPAWIAPDHCPKAGITSRLLNRFVCRQRCGTRPRRCSRDKPKQ
jgi:hypothetical protein